MKTTDAVLPAFFLTNIATCIDERNVGPHLLKYRILRHHLLDPETLTSVTQPDTVTNGLVVDLIIFCNKQQTGVNKLRILQMLGADVSVSEQVFNKKLKATMNRYVSLSKSMHRESGKQKMNIFLMEKWCSSGSDLQKPTLQSAPGESHRALASAQNTMAALRRQIGEKDAELKASIMEREVLISEKAKSDENVKTLLTKVNDMKTQFDQLKEDFKSNAVLLAEAQAEVSRTKQANYYKRLVARETKMEAVLQAHENGKCDQTIHDLQEIVQAVKKQIKQLQTQLSNNRKVQKKKILKKEETAARLQQAVEEMIMEEEEEERVIRLKDERGYFIPKAKVLIMTLGTEFEVNSERIGQVIEVVVRQVCNARVPVDDLPSQRTCLRMCDQAQVVTKAHVAEALRSSDHWDLHVDGTSRGGKKFVVQAVTTEDATLSMGYTPVATEDTSTLVDISIQVLEELSELHQGEEAQDTFAQMLQSLSAVMSDRASVMKSFGRALQQERQLLLQSDEGLDFLHCNAHFLLGLSTECKKVLAEEDKSRDEQPVGFYRPSESLAFRYIRMACDCLGPRGDDKNGCRDAWMASLLIGQKASTITSFRENRFNNAFQAPASLHYHRQDIEKCLSDYLLKPNKKLEVVLADCRNDQTDCHLIALGLVYFRVTGPYWSLLGSRPHYLDFWKYVEKLHQALQLWQQDSSSILQADCPPLFPDIQFRHHGEILQSILAIDGEKAAMVKSVLQKMCAAMLSVTERQLSDFLPEGRYYNIEDAYMREKLQHSHITNLVAEEYFADLDFSLFKRRSCSLFHHSTMNMLKRNKSMSGWFANKSSDDQNKLLKLSAQKAPDLRKQHIQAEKAAVEKRKEHLQEVERQKLAAEEKKNQHVLSILDTMKTHSGPCTSVADVDLLIMKYTSNPTLQAALKAEILFQKVVLHKRSNLLRVTGTALALTNRLRQFFGGDALEHLPVVAVMQPRKRARVELFPDSESDSTSEGNLSEAEMEQPEPNQQCDKNFKFTSEGEIVAVYYVEDFFIGEVTAVFSQDEGQVNFLVKADRQGTAMYKWPSRPDRATISSSAVFVGKLRLAPSSSSGRTFVVESPAGLPDLYEEFRDHLIENY